MQECIESALHDQEAIGWQNAIKGYMSVEWRTLADMSPYGNDHASPQGSGLSSLLHILRQFHRLASRQWRSRNQVLHGTNETSLQDIRDSELAEIHHIYAQPNQLTVADRHYCQRPLESIIKQSPATRRRWLRYTAMARKRMLQDGKRQTLLTHFTESNVPSLAQRWHRQLRDISVRVL